MCDKNNFCNFNGCPGSIELDEEIVEYEESITIGLEEFSDLHPSCKEILVDELEPSDYDSMHPEETVEEFLDHEEY
jgi:hypothetical protein